MNNLPRLSIALLSITLVVTTSSLLLYLTPRRPTPSNTSTSAPAIAPSEVGWQTYINDELMFQLKYPSNLWLGKLPNASLGRDAFELLTLSDKNQKRSEESAFYLSVYVAPGENVLGSGEEEILNLLDQYLNYRSLRTKYGQEVLGNFFGDPPRGYYYVYLPLKKTQDYPLEYLVFRASVPNSDYPAYGGDYSQRDLINQILSTFKFLKVCAGKNNSYCPTGFACKLSVVNRPESGGICVPEAETYP